MCHGSPAADNVAERGAGLAGWLDFAKLSVVFSFLYLKKIKISKIYVRFEIFQKYTPVALP